MLLLRSIVALAGLAFVIYLVLDAGRADVLDSFRHVGWGIFFVAAIDLVSLALRASAWRYLITPDPTVHWTHWFVSRWIRQAVSQLLPVAQVGGELAGARVLNKFGLAIELAVSSTVVDLTLGAGAQIIFTLVGITTFLSLTYDAPSAGWLFLFTLALLALILIFAYLQQRGLVGFVLRRATRNSTRFDSLIENADAIDQALRDIYQHRRRLGANIAIQLVTQIATSVEIWLVCLLIGSPLGIVEAFVIQSLTRAARAAAFFVPAGLGVQEISIFWLASAFGIPPTDAIAIAMVKRARELLVGLPALGVWSVLESRGDSTRVSSKR
jgi:putative membrane protein